MTGLEVIGVVFMIVSFLEENICPKGTNDEKLTPRKLHNTADEFKYDADALNNPSSKEQYIGKLEDQVEKT